MLHQSEEIERERDRSSSILNSEYGFPYNVNHFILSGKHLKRSSETIPKMYDKSLRIYSEILDFRSNKYLLAVDFVSLKGSNPSK